MVHTGMCTFDMSMECKRSGKKIKVNLNIKPASDVDSIHRPTPTLLFS